jgi:hypothetical protein
MEECQFTINDLHAGVVDGRLNGIPPGEPADNRISDRPLPFGIIGPGTEIELFRFLAMAIPHRLEPLAIAMGA